MLIVLSNLTHGRALMTVEEKVERTHESIESDEPKRITRTHEAQQAAVVEAAYILEAIRK
jgi:hypothetical protein